MRKLLMVIPLLLISCGVYSFKGSSLPSHLKTIEVPLFENGALIQGVAEDVTDGVSLAMQRERLKIVPREGDASIKGTIISYQNRAYDYGGNRDKIDIASYAVTITAKIEFHDNELNKDIYKGLLKGEGVYDFNTEDEDIGRRRAVKALVEKIMINSLQGW